MTINLSPLSVIVFLFGIFLLKNKRPPGLVRAMRLRTRGSDIVTRDYELQTRTPAGPLVPESLINLTVGQAAKIVTHGLSRTATFRRAGLRTNLPGIPPPLPRQVCRRRKCATSDGYLSPPVHARFLRRQLRCRNCRSDCGRLHSGY